MTAHKDTSPWDVVPIAIVQGPQGAEFAPAQLDVPAGASTLWRNETADAQFVVPFKGGPLEPGGTRLTSIRRPGTYMLRLQSNPAAVLTITAK